MIIDVEELREDLIDYLGTAVSYNDVAMMDLIEAERANDEGIVRMALKHGFNLGKYEIEKTEEKGEYYGRKKL
ncbi:MAG: hypothetical protein IJL74_01460 [Bacilli bacterium]|nr:hypothetical protein [Bacilli bacterium]